MVEPRRRRRRRIAAALLLASLPGGAARLGAGRGARRAEREEAPSTLEEAHAVDYAPREDEAGGALRGRREESLAETEANVEHGSERLEVEAEDEDVAAEQDERDLAAGDIFWAVNGVNNNNNNGWGNNGWNNGGHGGGWGGNGAGNAHNDPLWAVKQTAPANHGPPPYNNGPPAYNGPPPYNGPPNNGYAGPVAQSAPVQTVPAPVQTVPVRPVPIANAAPATASGPRAGGRCAPPWSARGGDADGWEDWLNDANDGRGAWTTTVHETVREVVGGKGNRRAEGLDGDAEELVEDSDVDARVGGRPDAEAFAGESEGGEGATEADRELQWNNNGGANGAHNGAWNGQGLYQGHGGWGANGNAANNGAWNNGGHGANNGWNNGAHNGANNGWNNGGANNGWNNGGANNAAHGPNGAWGYGGAAANNNNAAHGPNGAWGYGGNGANNGANNANNGVPGAHGYGPGYAVNGHYSGAAGAVAPVATTMTVRTESVGGYRAGDLVSYLGNNYACRPGAAASFCNQASRQPGKKHWDTTWEWKGTCAYDDGTVVINKITIVEEGDDPPPERIVEKSAPAPAPRPRPATKDCDRYPDYDRNAFYRKNDVVVNDGSHWKCVLPERCNLSKYRPALNNDHSEFVWEWLGYCPDRMVAQSARPPRPVRVVGKKGPRRDKCPGVDAWRADVDYRRGDEVSHRGSRYACAAPKYCPMAKFEPRKERGWELVWELLGACRGNDMRPNSGRYGHGKNGGNGGGRNNGGRYGNGQTAVRPRNDAYDGNDERSGGACDRYYEYHDGDTYDEGDVVVYDGSKFRCKSRTECGVERYGPDMHDARTNSVWQWAGYCD